MASPLPLRSYPSPGGQVRVRPGCVHDAGRKTAGPSEEGGRVFNLLTPVLDGRWGIEE